MQRFEIGFAGRTGSASALLALSMTLTVGCTVENRGGGKNEELLAHTPPGNLIASTRERLANPQVPVEDTEALIEGNERFTVSLYRTVRSGYENLFFSPHNISVAMAIAYAGARGNTAVEIGSALEFALPQDRLHPAFNGLEWSLRNADVDGFALHTVNQAFVAKDSTWNSAYLDLLAECYGADLRELDFHWKPDKSRLVINEWVENVTEGRIKDLLAPQSIVTDTVLVFANAIYFVADWANRFDKHTTTSEPFRLLDGGEVSVPTMHQLGNFPYYAGHGYQAVELPYAGERVAMLILVPDGGTFNSFDAAFDEVLIEDAMTGLEAREVDLSLPIFSFETEIKLKEVLRSLGVVDAFDMSRADFAGMRENGFLVIDDIANKAYVSVDEDGTEAAASTAVAWREIWDPQADVDFAVDRPFVFLIYDRTTGAILFVGRVLRP